MDDTLVIQDVDESDIVKTLKKTGYVCVDGDEEFKYLLNMQIRSFSKQKLEELKKAIEKLEAELKHVKDIGGRDVRNTIYKEFEKEFKSLRIA